MTTITGEVDADFKFADLEKFVIIDQGKFTLNLKEANIRTKCIFGRCQSNCLTTYCETHKKYSRTNAKINYSLRKRKAMEDRICIYPSCLIKAHIDSFGFYRTLCKSHLKYHRLYHKRNLPIAPLICKKNNPVKALKNKS
jgi:hypothetical protein